MNLRQDIYDLVAAIPPYDSLEEEHIASTLSWIDSGADLFRLMKPATPPKHLVSYFILTDSSEDKFLLVDHIKAELWLPSGGHVEPDEHPFETVKREVREELGIEALFVKQTPYFITVSKTTGKTAGHTDVSLWYILKGNSKEIYFYDQDEFHQIKWFKPDEIPKNSDPHLQRFLNKYKNES